MTYKIRIADADIDREREGIFSVLAENFPGLPQERYEWIYKGNPQGKTVRIIAYYSGERPIGTLTLFPRRIYANGEPLNCAITGDFCVNAKHRVFGPALALQRTAVQQCESGKFDLLYGIPNQQSRKVQLRAGFEELGKVLRLTKPLKSQYYIARRVRNKILLRLLSFVADSVLEMASRENFRMNSGGFSVLKPEVFDNEFDRLWNSVRKDRMVIGERSSAYLNWRFRQCPHGKYNIFAIMSSQDGITSYLVYKVEGRKVSISDLLAKDMHNGMDTLLSQFLQYLRGIDVEAVSISFLENKLLLKKLKKFGFSQRHCEDDVLVYVPYRLRNYLDLVEKGKWYILAGDNDI